MRVLFSLSAMTLGLLAGWGEPLRAAKTEAPKLTAPEAKSADIIVSGKMFCSLKQRAPLPFPGTIIEISAQPGQQVQAGEVMARYRLSPEALLQLRRRLSPPQIPDLEARLAEVDKNLSELAAKKKSLQQLTKEKLAPAATLSQTEKQMNLLGKQRSAYQERLNQERTLAKDDLGVLRKQLGQEVNPAYLPQEGVLKAPLSGYVLWVHPEIREGAEVVPLEAAFLVGVLNPMVIRAQVHEIEAQQLSLGEPAEVAVESLPGRKFEARVSRLPWAALASALDQPTYYEVEFKVDNPDLALKEGLKGRITVRRPR